MKYRVKAAFIHLCISAAIIGVFLAMVLFIWYPNPYDKAMRVWDALSIILIVDLALGPMLTLVIFDIKKSFKELSRDLSIIAIIQFSALIWGMQVTYSMRPVFNVFAVNQFYLFNRQDMINKTAITGQSLGLFERPKLVFSDFTSEGKQYDNVFSAIFEGDMDEALFLNPEKYLPFSEHKKEIKAQAKTPDALLQLGVATHDMLEAFTKKYGGKRDDYLYFRMQVDVQRRVIVFDKSFTHIVGIL